MIADCGFRISEKGINHRDTESLGLFKYILCISVSLWLMLFSSYVSAQSLDQVDSQITKTQSQINNLNKEYARLTQINNDRLKKVADAKNHNDATAAENELKAAYASAEQLNQINVQLNQLKSQKAQLCNDWRAIYRKTMDDLLAQAEQQKDRKQKADIGRKLQHYQQENAALCAENPDLFSTEWRSLQVESYDGPAEINQKIQMLQDISRELRITLTKLDTKYQDALRERKTKERAQEFIQEGTLFNDGSTLVTSSRTISEQGIPVNTPTTFESLPQQSPSENGSQAILLNDWQTTDNPEAIEQDYKKTHTELLSLQKDLQTKIEEFEKRAKNLQLP
jgi:hypothetical protein